MKNRWLALTFLFIVLTSLVFAVPKDSNKFYGTISGSGSGAGNTITAYIDDEEAGSITITTAGRYGCFDSSGVLLACTDGASSNVLSVTGTTGQTVTFKVGSTTCGTATFTEGEITRKNLDCGGGSSSSDTTGTTSGNPSTTTTDTPPSPPSEDLSEVTNPSIITDIKRSLPEGWDDIKVEQAGDTRSKRSVVSIGTIDNALSYASDEDAIAALENLKDAISSGESGSISTTTTLSIYKITNEDTGEIERRTLIKITFTAPYDMEDIVIIETIPKEVAESVDDMIFLGESPTQILQRDPVLEWNFDSMSEGQSKDLSYIVKDEIEEIMSITNAAGKRVVAAEPTPEPEPEEEPRITTAKVVIGISIMLLIVLIGLIIYFTVTKKKKEW